MPLHSPWIIQDATHKIVDALLTLIFKQVLWPCHYRICKDQVPIRWLWVYVVAKPLDYTWCNTQKRWHSVDTLLTRWWCSVDALLTLCWRSFRGVAVSTHTILPVKAANTSIMDKCRSTAFGLHMMEPTKSLTLWWRSVSDWGSDHIVIVFILNGCQ
jgi:hypothetical protein